MTVAVREYTDASAMLADYAERRKRMFAKPKPVLKVIEPAPVAEPEPEPKPDPLALYRLAYESAINPQWDIQIAKRLLSETAVECGFRPHDLQGESRHAPLARARQFAMWRIAKETGLSTPRIGNLFGGKDHTTVIHSIRRINEVMGENVRGLGNVWRGRRH